MQKFALNLQDAITSRTLNERAHSLRFMQEFKEEMSEFYGMKFRNILRGKMKGSTFAIGSSVNLGRFDRRFIAEAGDFVQTPDGYRFKSIKDSRKAAMFLEDVAADVNEGVSKTLGKQD